MAKMTRQEMSEKGYEKLLTFKEFDSMKIADYASIPRVMDMQCPECGKSDMLGSSDNQPKPIGWVDTPQGFMMVAECPFCFCKFRFHISTTDRNDVDGFYRDFALRIKLYRGKYK